MDTDRRLLADKWLSIFLEGENCKLCLFSQITTDDPTKAKKLTRECVAADARHCPAIFEGSKNQS
jgi:hypothetical protein